MNSDFLLKKSSYFYDLPQELIAQTPVEPRDSSRLLVAGKDGSLCDHVFSDLTNFMCPGDVLVINESKVIPARLFAKDINTGSPLEILLLRQKELDLWYCMVKPGKKAKPGKRFLVENGALEAEIVSIEENGDRLIRFTHDSTKTLMQILSEIGNMPLPHTSRKSLRIKTDIKQCMQQPTALPLRLPQGCILPMHFWSVFEEWGLPSFRFCFTSESAPFAR